VVGTRAATFLTANNMLDDKCHHADEGRNRCYLGRNGQELLLRKLKGGVNLPIIKIKQNNADGLSF